MSPSASPWLGFLLVAAGLWFGDAAVGAYTSNPASRVWIVRSLFNIGWVLSALVGVVRFLRWVWQA
ncbi:MAG: hypothetical protein WB869_18530 [Candidatus Acidiferrales bacterium]